MHDGPSSRIMDNPARTDIAHEAKHLFNVNEIIYHILLVGFIEFFLL